MKISTPGKIPAAADTEESVSEEETSNQVAKDQSLSQASDQPLEESRDSGENYPWQAYSNDFYALEYPANYKITGQNAAGEIKFEINDFAAEPVIFISAGEKALAFQGTWSVIPVGEADGQKLLATEKVDMNGTRFQKKYWAIRQIDDGAWQTAIVYYGCDQSQHCFSILRGVTAKGVPAWDEQSGSQLADKIKIKTLVNVMKTSKETDTINFNNMFLTFRFVEKTAASAASAAGAVSKTNQWKDCVFSPILTGSVESTDRKLVCIGDDGTQKIIAESIKTAMGWNGMAEFYPNKALFAPYSKEIYFTKYLSDSGSSSGVYALDVATLQFRRLANVGKIYEDYNNYASIISPDRKLIASLGYSDLYILDFAADKATAIAIAAAGEVFNPAGSAPDFKWIDNGAIQYPVYKNSDFSKPAEIRKIVVK